METTKDKPLSNQLRQQLKELYVLRQFIPEAAIGIGRCKEAV
ncbi:hypothetical protein [Flavisolibacter nicotianae]|nr:hypothetical protein [Flavisolibacter nicotianae]